LDATRIPFGSGNKSPPPFDRLGGRMSEDVSISGGANGDVADRDAPRLVDGVQDLVDDVLGVEHGVADRFGIEIDVVEASLFEGGEHGAVLGHVLPQDPDGGGRAG